MTVIVRFCPLPQKEQQAQRRQQSIAAKMMPSAVPASSRRVGSRRKLNLYDLKIGFDGGETGARLIRLARNDKLLEIGYCRRVDGSATCRHKASALKKS
jgi:hypothetical protein